MRTSSPMYSFVLSVLVGSTLFGLGGSCAFADARSASLTVTVADGSGAVIPDATVTLRNTQTAQEQIAVTNRSGTAIFPFLKPSTYSLLVHRSNFSDLALDRISLNVGD